MHRLPAIFITAVCTVLLLGLCTTTAEARAVSRVTAVSRAGQDWHAGKLKVRWRKVHGATRYQMRYASSLSRLPIGRVVRTRSARGTFTHHIQRSKTWFVQVRALKRHRKGAWSTATRMRFVRPGPVGTGDATVPPPTGGTRFGFWAGPDTRGSSTSARDNFNRVSGYMGAPQAYRMFYSGLPSKSFVGSNADFGPPVVVSFKAPPADIIAGKDDAYLSAWFKSIPSTRTVWWSYWHEPEDDIEAGRYTAAQYRAAWEHLIALAPKRSTLRPTLILMGFSLFKKSRVISSYVPKGLDVLAWDSYLTGTTKTLQNVIEKPKSVSDSYGLGFGIAETAVASGYNLSGMDHAQTVRELAHGLRTRAAGAAQFVTWFESNKSDGDWRIRPFGSAVSAWRSGS